MKILLIDPPGGQTGWNAGLAYLSGALERAGIEHVVFDMVNFPLKMRDLMDFAVSFKPDLIGLSVKTATFFSALQIAEELKGKFPEIPVIGGGPHATLYPKDFFVDTKNFDAVIVGEAEESLPELILKGLSSNSPLLSGFCFYESEEVRITPPKVILELDSLPFPQFAYHHLFVHSLHPYPLITSRGCPYGCIYCSVGKVSGKKWRKRSPEHVIEEMERAIERWGFQEFEVLDDTFTQDVNRVIEICELIIKRDLRIRWSCPNGIRADKVTAEMVSAMARSGCHTVIFGVETGNEELFKTIRKGETLNDIAKAIRLAKGAGMRVGGYFIIGLPGDSFEKNMKSLEFSRTHGLDWAHFNILAPYPGTPVWDEIQRRGRFLTDYRSALHFSTDIKPIFELNDFSANEIVDTYKTVHVRQRLFHLLLPSAMSPIKRQCAIRKLRMRYDRELWLKDIKRDIRKALQPIVVPMKSVFWMRGRKKRVPPALYPPRLIKGKIRILMVNDYIGKAGGTEKYIYDLVENLTSMGHEVAWAFQRDLGSLGVDIPIFPMIGLMEPAHQEEVEKRLDSIIERFEPDVIHIHNVHAPQIVKASLARLPTIRTVHDHNIICPSMNKMWRTGDICYAPAGAACLERLLDKGCHVVGLRWRLMLERLDNCLDGIQVNRRLPKILVTSSYMRDTLIQNGFDSARLETLPLFVDFSRDTPPPDKTLPLKILWVGRVVLPDKGTDFFIESLARMRAPYRAVLAGDGPGMEFVKYKAKELNVEDKIDFRGRVSFSEMEELYEWCHVVAFTSMWGEPFGYVGIESAAHSRPVVAFDAGGVRDWLVDREGGFIVYRGNTRAFALRLDRLAFDPGSRIVMGQAHKEHAKSRYDKNKHLNRLLEIYRELSVQYSGGEKFFSKHVPIKSRKKTKNSSARISARKSIAFFSPLPPQKGGVALYGETLARELAKFFDIVFYIDEGYIPCNANKLGEIRNHTDYRREEDFTLFQATNSPLSAYMYPYLLEGGGILTLHDRTLYDMAIRYWEWRPRTQFWGDFFRNEGLKGIQKVFSADNNSSLNLSKRILNNLYFDEERKRTRFTFLKLAVKRAKGIITHSLTVKNSVMEAGANCPIMVSPLAVEQAPPQMSPQEARRHLELGKVGIDSATFVALAFGFIQRHKRIELLLEAWARFVKKEQNVKLILLGPRSPDFDVDELIMKKELSDKVLIDDSYPPMEKVYLYFFASDLCFNLRYPVYGSSSYSLTQMMSAGKPCVVTDLETFSEFSEDMVIKAPIGDKEVEFLENILMHARENPVHFEEIGKRARKYIESHCLWEQTGAKYRDFLLKLTDT